LIHPWFSMLWLWNVTTCSLARYPPGGGGTFETSVHFYQAIRGTFQRAPTVKVFNFFLATMNESKRK
jgi:hypothetical protein